jgi:hypothetical protein
MTFPGGTPVPEKPNPIPTNRQGPIYDRAMRTLIEDDLGAFCEWLGEPHEAEADLMSSSFTAETMHADLVARVAPGRIVHAEYILQPNRAMTVRMVAYLARLLREYPDHSITQYAIVLDKGNLPSVDDPRTGFTLGLRTLYLRESKPAPLLVHPGLGGLAVLAEGDEVGRGHSLKEAIQGVNQLPTIRQERLINAMVILASITLKASTIDLIAKETGMTIETVAQFYLGTEVGQEILKQGTAKTLAALLRSRFGDDPRIPSIAGCLVLAGEASYPLISEVSSLEDLYARLLPTQPTA